MAMMSPTRWGTGYFILPWKKVSSRNRYWRPISLRGPILGGFMIASLSIIIILEVLSRLSTRPENGSGLAFAGADGLSTIANLGYFYLPTILAVCYSMIWSWVNLDVNRLEPWFQLSKEHGATAEDSILLQYPYDFFLKIPVTAFRKRHWVFFWAGSTMLTIIGVIGPFQSSIFITGTVARSIATAMATSAQLGPITTQVDTLTANFMDMAYGIAWLDEKLPPFVTSDLAFLPFKPAQLPAGRVSTDLWNTTVDTFYTNLTCSPAVISIEGTSYTFSNGAGCIVPDIALTDTGDSSSTYMVTYIGYYDNPQSDWALQNPNCSSDFANNFLALWASSSTRLQPGVYGNLTALFCQTSYTSQKMQVAVNASTNEIHSYYSLRNDETIISLDEIFNITNFEYLLGVGVPSSSQTQRYNFPDSSILQQDARIKDYGIVWPNSNMVGFAAALSTSGVEDWGQPSVLQHTFQNAHQLLFISAFSTLTSTAESMENIRSGTVQHFPSAVIMVRPISIVVEFALGVVIVFIGCLWWCSHRRASLLWCDPASTADVMSLIRSDYNLAMDMHDDGTLTKEDLEISLSRKKYQITYMDNGRPRIQPLHSPHAGALLLTQSSSPVYSHRRKDYSPVRPFELRLPAGLFFILLLISALSAAIFLHVRSLRHNGITLPSESPIVLSIITNYAPTTFATLVEPMWGILSRFLCLLQPFEELRIGSAHPSTSIKSKYTTLPPQLAFWRALKARHFFLAIVCITAVSPHVLAVSLAALLNLNPITTDMSFPSTQKFFPYFNGNPIYDSSIASGFGLYFDHFYIVMSNFSHGASLPPWIDEGFFYIPFEFQSVPSQLAPQASVQSFRGNTTGFGADVTCVELASDGNNQVFFDITQNGSSTQLMTSILPQNGQNITCINLRGAETYGLGVQTGTFDLGQFLALEVEEHMEPVNNEDDGGFCAASLVMGWVRSVADATNIYVNAPAVQNRSLTSTFLSCSQRLLAAEFEVEVDSTGRILNSRQLTDFGTDVSSYFFSHPPTNGSSISDVVIRNETSLFQKSTELIASYGAQDLQWHNDSLTSDWLNSLLGMITNSSSLVDPTMPVPNATFIAPVVENLYKKLFAILLSLNTHVFDESTTPMTVKATFTETRIFLSPLMFQITIVILSCQIIVAIMFYANRPKRFLPRLPTSIASIIAFVATSRALEDFNGDKTSQDDEDEKRDGEEKRYAYGAFVGTDGRMKVGIEKQRFVIPAKVMNPHVKRRKWWARMGRGGEGEAKS